MTMTKIIDVGYQFFGPDEHPPMEGKDHSIDVLIDMNGFRKNFAIGWYDSADNSWRFHQEDTSYLDLKNMKWTYLPLA